VVVVLRLGRVWEGRCEESGEYRQSTEHATSFRRP
jgi:hypothetical protein